MKTEPEGLAPLAPAPAARDRHTAGAFWSALDVLFMASLALPALLAAGLTVLGVSTMVPQLRHFRAAQVLAMQFLFWGIWFAALSALLRLRYGRPFWPSLGWRRPPAGYGQAALLGALTAGAVIAGAVLLRPPQIPLPLLELLKDPLSLALVGLFAITLGPVCEELAFRGFLLPWLAGLIKPLPAVLLTGALFAILHGPEYAWSWRHVLLITVAGAAFGAVRLRTGSTAAAAVTHAMYNLVFFAALLIQTASRLR
ncbi:MAG: CPBP family intramembrane glutamic endopeptidase [Bryobacterales bacterium]|nr:CPBP family intramembrane metalloprotease [Bryobacteraceae bacterium]MDW8131313.1 CPBP family intramembrane glutamic endopeptidase [Bryobacterales bacterium]